MPHAGPTAATKALRNVCTTNGVYLYLFISVSWVENCQMHRLSSLHSISCIICMRALSGVTARENLSAPSGLAAWDLPWQRKAATSWRQVPHCPVLGQPALLVLCPGAVRVLRAETTPGDFHPGDFHPGDDPFLGMPHKQERQLRNSKHPFQQRTRQKDKNGLKRKKLPPNKMFFLISHGTEKFLHGRVVRVESITLHTFCLET